MPSETPQDFRDRAAECQRVAETMVDPKARETLLYVASRWLALAQADADNLISKDVGADTKGDKCDAR